MKFNFGINFSSVSWKAGQFFSRLSFYLLPAIVGLAILFSLLIVIRPRVTAIFQLRTKLAQDKEKVSVLEKKLKTLKGLNYDKLLADAKKIEVFLPSDKNLPSLLFNLETLAATSGVQIAAVQLAPGEIAPQSGKIEVTGFPIKMTVIGNFTAIKTFLGKILTGARLMSVDSLTITSTAQATASLSATLDLDSYFQSLDATKVVIDEPLTPLTSEEERVLLKILPSTPVSTFPTVTAPTGKPDPFSP